MTRVSSSENPAALFSDEEYEELRARWEEIQSTFVHEPRKSVEEADELVEDVLSTITSTFERERRALEQRWEEDSDVSTEDLRVTLQRYRTFFDRLLNASF